MLRMCRSIQVEGAFGLMKHDFWLSAILFHRETKYTHGVILSGNGVQPKKRWMKQSRNREKTHLSTIKTA